MKCFVEIKFSISAGAEIFLVIDSGGGTCSGLIKLGQMTDGAEVGDIISQCQPVRPTPLTPENNIDMFLPYELSWWLPWSLTMSLSQFG